jgi:hypothetical protein
MITRGLIALLVLMMVQTCASQESPPEVKAAFRVRYLASGSVYIEGGRSDGLSEGMRLVIKQSTHEGSKDAEAEPGIDAQLTVVSVAASSSVCEVISAKREIVVGDMVTLQQADVEKLVERRTLSNTRAYPAIVSFTEGDPLDEDVRETIPAPPLPEVNQARGRIGIDFNSIQGLNPTNSRSTQFGLVVQANITRILGTYWSLNGYWRGRLQSSSYALQPTLQDLINRTYQLALTYNNPNSRWTMGVGRLYLPWASSLQTIDGGYVGWRVADKTTVGAFGGSTPDPTAWNYDPHRQLAGGFVNISGGSYENVLYSTTTGVGVSMINWQTERPYVFNETNVAYKRVLSAFEFLDIDRPRTDPSLPPVGVGVGQSLFTLRYQPKPRIAFDLNDTYFRDVPTFDPALIGTGLLDKYLFQGLSGGVRVELPLHLAAYASLGRSSTSTDTKGSWNQMYGLTVDQIWRTGLRVDARYSKFDSAFAQGSYQSLAVSSSIGDSFHMNVQLGRQSYISPYAVDNNSIFLNSIFDLNIGTRYFLESGFTLQRGGTQNYNQFMTTFGYRFNNRSARRE